MNIDASANTDVLIVGGGFSGIALAANLARRSPGQKVIISRKKDGPTFGAAYETECPLHLLNVPTKGMSAFADSPTDFLDWLACKELALSPNDFAPRMFYRQYLESVLEQAMGGGSIEVTDDETIGIQRQGDGWQCLFRSGATVLASSVVLSFGGFPPGAIPELSAIRGHSSYISNPWKDVDLSDLGTDGHVGIVGTGLTALDVVLSLEHKGYKGRYTMLSRRGLLPHSHDLTTAPLPVEHLPPPNPCIKELVRNLRKAADKAEEYGTNWRAVLDGMRPKVASYWIALSEVERQRFLRHVRPLWEIHRHRVAPAIATRIAALRSEGRLCVAAGRLLTANTSCGRVQVQFVINHPRDARNYSFDLLFNCTGPVSKVTCWPSPLIRELLASGDITTDPLERGISFDENGNAISAMGHAQPGLFVLGHPRRGQLWESTAVPELRTQARELSVHLGQLDRR